MTAYLDNASTTRLRPEVLQAMLPVLRDVHGNPSSIHAAGRRARRVIEDARELIADRIKVSPLQVIFTSGATEANNLALFGTAPKRLVASGIEHESVLRASQRFSDVVTLPVDAQGRVSRIDLERALPASLVSVMMVNNEVGTIQPVAELADVAHAHGALMHVDAVQALGKIPFDFPSIGADLASLSSHKIHGPKGVGALIVRDAARVRPILYGGAQEFEKRAGTENVAGIVGFAKAVELAFRDLPSMARVAALRDRLESSLGGSVNGDPSRRAPHISNLRFDGVDGEALVMALDGKGVCVSAGSACAALGTEPSHVLQAMGLSPDAVRSSVRFSLALDTSDDEVDEALRAVREVLENLEKVK